MSVDGLRTRLGGNRKLEGDTEGSCRYGRCDVRSAAECWTPLRWFVVGALGLNESKFARPRKKKLMEALILRDQNWRAALHRTCACWEWEGLPQFSDVGAANLFWV